MDAAVARGFGLMAPRKNRVQTISWDRARYKLRYAVECAFNRLKQARRFATRYEKTLRNYSAVVAVSCAALWLRAVGV